MKEDKIFGMEIERTALGFPITEEIVDNLIKPIINKTLSLFDYEIAESKMISWVYTPESNYRFNFTIKPKTN